MHQMRAVVAVPAQTFTRRTALGTESALMAVPTDVASDVALRAMTRAFTALSSHATHAVPLAASMSRYCGVLTSVNVVESRSPVWSYALTETRVVPLDVP